MADYRYLFADLLTNAPLAELPVFGTYFEKFVNATGNATFSYKIGQDPSPTGLQNDAIANSATIPGRTAMYVDRDGQLIWGGIVWSRTYQSQAKTVSCTAQTFDSLMFKRICRRNLSYSHTADEQRNICIDLINKMQSDGTGTNIGLTLPATFGANSSKQRDLNIHDYDLSTYGDLVQGVYALADGFDFLIDVSYVSNTPTKQVLMGYPNLGDGIGAPNLALEYPGTIFNYFYPESPAATKQWEVGSGDGKTKKVSSATATPLVSGGYPLIEAVDSSHTDVTVQDTLDGWATADLKDGNKIIPTIDMNPSETPSINDIQVGSYYQLKIVDPRFPYPGFSQAIRVTGWTLTPSSDQSVETATLVVDGVQQ